MDDPDIVIIGAGHQGLVCAATLAEAGLRPLVLEAASTPGGAVASGELTVPGLVHDVCATNMNLFLGSPFHAVHGEKLASLGLRFARSDAPYASAFPDGSSLRVTTDEAATAAMWAGHSTADAAGWRQLRGVFDDFAAAYLPIYTHPFPSVQARHSLAALRRRSGGTELGELGQVLLSSTRALGERYFATPEARSLVAAWGMHLDYAPDIAGGAVFPLLELYADMLGGMSIVEGGAGRLADALVALVRELGGDVRCDARVTGIDVGTEGVRAVLVGDQRIPARRVVSTAVLPITAALLSLDRRPATVARSARDYRFGPGTFMLHLAMDGEIPWADPRLGAQAYVHIGPYVDDMARTYGQSVAGQLPDEPLLVVGQTSVVDPSRLSPEGYRAVWIQVRTVPSSPGAGSWEHLAEGFAEQVIDKLDRYAPGVRGRIVGKAHLSPADLERRDANLVGGDSVSGSHHLDQFIGMRPGLAISRYRTPVDGLYLAGAGTWPGAGVNAISGQLAAEAVLRDASGRLGQLRRRLLRR
ncbi:dehydrogenase [Terrabacter tumescens]|uniref:Pyridine nucleotide-disulfide oxidoreductase domain-containing protein 2 n=1 Tax=Terrabacter tumescens TaxID=60443 RepID=A0ABQ2I2F5_9MICO|nr:NAD(P)/FAD-dependent oxidoreductase [Terrabacter tumescens]GGM98533.1 dehydrogenase [Terrabacter tumescens]